MRRTGAAFGVLALVSTMAGCWVQPGFDAGRSSWNPDETELTSTNVHNLTELWDAPMPSAERVNAPVSVSDTIYVTTRTDVAAVDAATGVLRWDRNLDDDELGFFPDLGAPVWDRGALLVPTSFHNQVGTVEKLDPADGSTISTTPGDAVFELAVADERIAVLSGRLNSSGLAAATISWTYSPSGPLSSGGYPGASFAIVGDRIQWSYGTSAQGFSAACPPYPPDWPVSGCAPDWTTPLAGTPTAPVGIGTTQVVYGDSSGTVTVLDTATGAVAWTAELGAGISRKPAVADGNLLVATDDGRLVALPAAGCGTATTCTPLWSASLGAAPSTGPAVGGDVAYIGVGGDIVAFARDGCGQPTCPELTRISTGTSPVTGGPIVHDGRLVVGTGDGHLVAFGLPG